MATITTLDAFIARVIVVVKAVDGVRNVPDYPPDQLNIWPAVVVYAARGEKAMKDFGLGPGLNDVAVEVHLPRKDLARELAVLTPFVTSIPEALSGDTQLNQFYGAMSRITYTLFTEPYGGVDTIGYRFVIEKVKL